MGRMEDDLISIGEAAAKFGLTVSALRYWDECDLAGPAERRGGRRWYGPAELHRIALIRIMQETGLMSLDEIRHVLAAAPDWRGTVAGRIEAIAAQIERLTTGRAVTLRAQAGLEFKPGWPRSGGKPSVYPEVQVRLT